MLVALDIDYGSAAVTAACVGFATWDAAEADLELVVRAETVPEPYAPGELYRRELPHLLAALDRVDAPIEVVVVDGYVWLGPGRPGLGARLHRALGERTPVVGVAKNPFAGAAGVPVRRGASARPLFVTAAGMDAQAAAQAIQGMHGSYRVPTLLRRVDRLARGLAAPARRPPRRVGRETRHA